MAASPPARGPYRFEGAVAGDAVGEQRLRAGGAGRDEGVEDGADVVVGAAAQLVDAGQLDPEVAQSLLHHQHRLEEKVYGTSTTSTGAQRSLPSYLSL